MGQHDLSYRLFFAHRRMIQERSRPVPDREEPRLVGGPFERSPAAAEQAFETWLRKVILPRFGLSQEEDLTLEELETMLAESIDRWNHEIREEGRQEFSGALSRPSPL